MVFPAPNCVLPCQPGPRVDTSHSTLTPTALPLATSTRPVARESRRLVKPKGVSGSRASQHMAVFVDIASGMIAALRDVRPERPFDHVKLFSE